MGRVPVLLFGDHIAAYGVVRALGPLRIPIFVVSRGGRGLCTYSRYVEDFLALDAKDGDFLAKLTAWVTRRVGAEAVLMIAGEDDYLERLSRDYDSLVPNLRPTFPPWEVVERVRHKKNTYEIAEKIGIPVPITAYVASEKELMALLNDGFSAPFPILLKCDESKAFKERYGTKGVVSFNEAEIFDNYRKYDGFLGRALLQEMIPGGENQLLNFIGIYNRNSEPVDVFMNRKRRSSQQFLSCTLMETMWSEEVLTYSNRLIKKIGYYGYANPEYKYDARDGKLKLIEVNGRISMSNSHALRCGINVIFALYREALEGPLQSRTVFVKNYPDRVLWWIPLADLTAVKRMFVEGSLGLREFIKSMGGSGYIIEPMNLRDPYLLVLQILKLARFVGSLMVRQFKALLRRRVFL